MAHRRRIRLEANVESLESESTACGLPSIERRASQLSLPNQDVLLQALEVASGPEELARLREIAATYHDVAQRLKVAKDELVRLAIWRIDVERKLGEELARTVERGGRGSKLQAATSNRGGATHGLPDSVDKYASKRCQDLAAIPESVLSDYYASAAARVSRAGQTGPLRVRASGTTSSRDPLRNRHVPGLPVRRDALLVGSLTHSSFGA